MINLIPNKEKKLKKRDFYIRLLIVFFVVMSIAFILVSILIMPYYLFSLQKKNLADEKLQALKDIPLPQFDKNTQNLVKDIDSKLNLIEKVEKDRFLVSERIIDEIILNKMPDIKITQISYDDGAKGKSVNIKGKAPSRDRLFLFRLALENNANFEKVDLPISNFIKGTNLEFDINLIPRLSDGQDL